MMSLREYHGRCATSQDSDGIVVHLSYEMAVSRCAQVEFPNLGALGGAGVCPEAPTAPVYEVGEWLVPSGRLSAPIDPKSPSAPPSGHGLRIWWGSQVPRSEMVMK